MKSTQYFLKLIAAAAVLTLGGFTGCESSSDGLSSWSGGGYYGYGFHDPYYYGGYGGYYDRDIVVAPPGDRPDRPSRPNGPSIPSTPRPMPRGGGGRR